MLLSLVVISNILLREYCLPNLFSCQKSSAIVSYNRYALWSAPELMLKHQNPANCCATRILMFEQVSNISFKDLVELNGIEPLTPCLQSRCSPS